MKYVKKEQQAPEIVVQIYNSTNKDFKLYVN